MHLRNSDTYYLEDGRSALRGTVVESRCYLSPKGGKSRE